MLWKNNFVLEIKLLEFSILWTVDIDAISVEFNNRPVVWFVKKNNFRVIISLNSMKVATDFVLDSIQFPRMNFFNVGHLLIKENILWLNFCNYSIISELETHCLFLFLWRMKVHRYEILNFSLADTEYTRFFKCKYLSITF